MKTIYINGRFLGAPLSGVPRYGRSLLRELDAVLDAFPASLRVEILVPGSVLETQTYKHLKIRAVGQLHGHAWEQLELPLYAWNGVLFTPTGSAPILHRRNVLTIHDAIVFAAPAGFSRMYMVWYRILSLILSRTALKVITVSEFSKRELQRWCGAMPDRVSVIYPGVDHLLKVAADPGVLQRNGLSRFAYALAVGSVSPNKNFKGILSALPLLADTELAVVFIGRTGAKVGQHGSKAATLDTSDVKDLGVVTDAELRALYENAGCFVFPSFYEGFGLPPLEALSLGCPTVVSNTASLPEVCGAVALLCNPNDPADIAMAIKKALRLRDDPLNAKRYAEFAARYNSRECARATLELLLSFAADMGD